MNPKPETFRRILERLLSVICVILLIPGDTLASATYTGGSQTTAPQSSPTKGQGSTAPAQGPTQSSPRPARLSRRTNRALSGPHARPRPLPRPPIRSELIQLQQWLVKHPTLKDKALADAVAKEPWDPSVQAIAALPESSSGLQMTSSGRPIWAMHFSHSKRTLWTPSSGCARRRRTKAI